MPRLSPTLALLLSTVCAMAAPRVALAEGEGDAAFERLIERKREDQRAIIREFFAGKRAGTFLDVGCAHYRSGSMTYFLEKDFGWSGVAVDALEHWAADYRTHRPGTRFFAYIVTDENGARQPFYRLTGDIGSTALADRAGKIEDEFDGIEVTEILVPTTTLDALLEREGVTKIDFLSMDIEGGEPKALAGFDIERFQPDLVGIEALPETREAILRYMSEHGYRRIDAYLERDPRNWFFTPGRADLDSATLGD